MCRQILSGPLDRQIQLEQTQIFGVQKLTNTSQGDDLGAVSTHNQWTREKMDPISMQNWLERTIQEAQERGLFDDLEGAGRPINWEDESLVDKEWLMAFRIMREQGFAPEWIELNKEISAELKKAREAVVRAWDWRQERMPGAREGRRRYIEGEWRRARAAFAETVAELNAKILDFNLVVPIPSLQRFKLDLDQELAALGIDAR